MRGVILDGEVANADGVVGSGVLLFVELNADEGNLVVRRAYGERASVLFLELDAVEAALAALKYRAAERTAEPTADVEP